MVYITAWFFPQGIIRAPVAAVIPRSDEGKEPGVGVYFYAALPGDGRIDARGRNQSWLWDHDWHETLDEAKAEAARQYAALHKRMADNLARLEKEYGSLPVREVT
jgi:hypothetical protein